MQSKADTLTEFERELEEALNGYATYLTGRGESKEYDHEQAIEVIIQAIDKHVIGEDVPNKPFTNGEVNRLGIENYLRGKQRKALGLERSA